MTTYYIKSDVIRKRPEWKQKELERRIGDPQTVVINRASITAQAGREAWTYLHTTDDSPEVALAKFEAMIPSYGCSCRNHYANLKNDYPPDFTDADSFWRWGWFIHNSVNEKLGKAIVSLEEARKIWNRPQPTE